MKNKMKNEYQIYKIFLVAIYASFISYALSLFNIFVL